MAKFRKDNQARIMVGDGSDLAIMIAYHLPSHSLKATHVGQLRITVLLVLAQHLLSQSKIVYLSVSEFSGRKWDLQRWSALLRCRA